MGKLWISYIVCFMFVFALSCNEPNTTVTNIVYSDGSVRRRIEIRSEENKFSGSEIQVPFDSTWVVRDSIEISQEGDTTWVRRAEKLFPGVDEINEQYFSDSGSNKAFLRSAHFIKRFKWFSTEYTFSEVVGKRMKFGYPVGSYMKPEELRVFYSPYELKEEQKNGPDSTAYRLALDTIDKKIERWMIESISSECIHLFADMVRLRSGDSLLAASVLSKESEIVQLIRTNADDFDSLLTNGLIARKLLGEKYTWKFETEMDSSAKIAFDNLFPTFSDYRVKTIMPGTLTSTNGFVDSSGVILWPVSADYFLTEDYIMKASSRTINLWAWIVSGAFILFVISGLAWGKKRKG